MNKISKKIVALVTMAAFVLTLVPFAAFAASTDTTGYVVDANNNDTANQAAVTITLSDEDLSAVKDTSKPGNVIVWAEDANGVIKNFTEGTNATVWEGVKYLSGAAFDANKATVTFNNLAAGTYTFYVTVNTNANGYAKDLAAAKAKALTVQSAYVYGTADRDHSSYGVIENGGVVATVDATTDKAFTTEFVVNDVNDAGTTANLANVVVWAEEDGQPTNFVKFEDGDSKDGTTVASGMGDLNGTAVTNVENGAKVKVTFKKAGTYKLYAGEGTTLTQAKNKQLQGTTTVTVTDEAVTIDSMKVSAKTTNGKTANISFDSNNMGKLDLTTVDPDFDYDGIDKVTLTGYVYDENNKPLQGKTITLTTNKDDVVEIDNNAVSAVTDNYGKFTVTFSMPEKSNAIVYLTNEQDSVEYSIQIIAAKTSAQNIDRTVTGGYVLAGNDKTYGEEVYGNNAQVSFADAVQFKVTDQKGEEVTGPIDGVKVDVRAVADDSTLDENVENIKFIWDADNSVYTLAYQGDDYKTDLIPGKYEVRVALPSEDSATVTFNVAKFGTVQETVLDVKASDYDQTPANPNEEWMTVDDQVTLGQTVKVEAKYVDANGIKVDAKNVSYGFNGKAVVDVSNANNLFGTPADIPANESLLGSEIEIIAFNTAKQQLASKTVTVVDSYTDKDLAFDPEQGPVSKDNKVNVSVVNADGKVQQVSGTVTAWVADQSNEKAKVSVDTTNAKVSNGKGSIVVYSDEETTADIVVVVKAGTEAYYATLHYTFGSEDPLANRTVVMTIGSTEYVVNNNIIKGDAAPFVDSNWRTMVPIRALAEAFDADVEWDNDARTVTINYENETIVMTVGETTYTINGEEATMDTEAVIKGDRTYVPIRFAAEAMGFTVTPLYNENSSTASVVFQS